jgi:hypothetical protein
MAEISIEHSTGKTIKGYKAILDRYVVFLRSNDYDSVGSEGFGANLEQYIDEQKNETTYSAIRRRIVNQTKVKFPTVQIQQIAFRSPDSKTIQIDMEILIVPTGTKTNFQINIS